MVKDQRMLQRIGLLACLLAAAFCGSKAAANPIFLSSGHVDIFEAEYEVPVIDPGPPEVLGPPVIHLGVHHDGGHEEPGDVTLVVNPAAYALTGNYTSNATILAALGTNSWILPFDTAEADALGVIEAGVAKIGFPDSSPVTFTMLSAGASNPGNFVLFASTGVSPIRLQTTLGTVDVGSFDLSTGHVHWNWGFSAPGTYTFDMQASYGSLQSPIETYTFQVVPEPSTWALAGTAVIGLVALRGRFAKRQ